MIPTELLDHLNALHAAATPGPWAATSERADGGAYIDPLRPKPGGARGLVRGVPWVGHANQAGDAALIVAAVNHQPQLVAALRAVLKLHVPVEWHEETEPGSGELDPNKPLSPFCHECTDDEYVDTIEFGDTIDQGSPVVYWPCRTVEAVTAALVPAVVSD